MAGFERLIVPALNHLIQKESWAKERLQPFSGAQLQISAGSIQIQLCIDGQGLFALGGDERTVDVTVRRTREKIEPDQTKFKYILTRRGTGYLFPKDLM